MISMSVLAPSAFCASRALKKLRPIRPNPLTPTRTVTVLLLRSRRCSGISLVVRRTWREGWSDAQSEGGQTLIAVRVAEPFAPQLLQGAVGFELLLRRGDLPQKRAVSP